MSDGLAMQSTASAADCDDIWRINSGIRLLLAATQQTSDHIVVNEAREQRSN
jgi:hypothetical protein